MSIPAKERVNELVTEITSDLWKKYEDWEPGIKRSNDQITFLIRELAFERAANEILKK